MTDLPLKHLSVKGYQSLHDVDLEFAPFTVLVGPSSSGKSAVVRAIDLLLRNKRGTAFIEHGQTKTKVSAQIGEHTVTLDRGTSAKAEANAYTLDSEPPFTKLGGAVPDRVSDALRLPAELTIAGQFDSPHLLTLTAPEITRTLGTLTNVDAVHRAAASARRVRLQQSQAAKTHRASLSEIDANLETMQDLEQQDALLTKAEEAHSYASEASVKAAHLKQSMDRVDLLEGRLESAPKPQPTEHLTGLVESAERAAEAVQTLQSALDRAERAEQTFDRTVVGPNVSALPRLQREAEEADSHLNGVVASVQAVAAAQAKIRDSQSRNETATAAYEAAEREFHTALDEAGTCPLCGSVVRSEA